MGETYLHVPNLANLPSNPSTNTLFPRCTIPCPSARSRRLRSAIPPGYLGFSSPPLLSVRQYGVVRFLPAASASADACAAIHEKIPVVIGQAIVVPCRRASALRSSSIVVSFPFRTRRISSSTSFGAGITHVPDPQRLLFVQSIVKTFGSPLLSASFSCQLFLVRLMVLSPSA